MMKAYVVTESISHEISVLVFSDTASGARNIANARDEMDSFHYVDMRAKRAKWADGHENDSEGDLRMLQIRNGWWFEVDGHIIDSDNVDEMIKKGII